MNDQFSRMALGMAVGIGVGAVIGAALENIAIGIAIGIAIDHSRPLIPQLSSSAAAPQKRDLQRVVGSSATALLIAKSDDIVKGMLTLAVFHVPTGARAIIEDVVVDERHRGQGIAVALVQNALARAEAAGARTVDLTSRPSREAANRLYRKLGFEKRETNVYRFSFGK